MTHGILYAVSSGLWTGLAVLNGHYAQTKNDRGYKWFLISLALGPLASVLLAFRPTPDRSPGEPRLPAA
jgi:hypothetical protein